MTRVAILGATGAVGTTLLRVLEERAFPLDELRLLASERSAGRRVRYRGDGHRRCRPSGRAASTASTSRSSRPARRARASGRRTRSPRAPSWSTTPRPSAWTTACRSSCADVNPQAARAAHGPDREPELLDDAARCRCSRPLHRRSPLEHVTVVDLPVGLGHGPEGGRRAARASRPPCSRASSRTAERLPAPHRVQRAAVRRVALRATTATPTRSSSSSTSRARSSSCPTCA